MRLCEVKRINPIIQKPGFQVTVVTRHAQLNDDFQVTVVTLSRTTKLILSQVCHAVTRHAEL